MEVLGFESIVNIVTHLFPRLHLRSKGNVHSENLLRKMHAFRPCPAASGRLSGATQLDSDGSQPHCERIRLTHEQFG